MIRTKVTKGLLIGIIGLLLTNMVVILRHDEGTLKSTVIILHRFDQTDIKRLNEMVERHKNGKGDYLMPQGKPFAPLTGYVS